MASKTFKDNAPVSPKGSVIWLLREFDRIGVEYELLAETGKLVRYIDNAGEPHLLKATLSDLAPIMSYLACEDKLWMFGIMRRLGIPTPATEQCESLVDAQKFMKFHTAIVLKPLDGAHGHGVSVNIREEKQLEVAFQAAKAYSESVLVQKYIEGKDLRILVIGGKFVSALERRPAHVIGDGIHTTEELISLENSRKNHRSHYKNAELAYLQIDACKSFLGEAGLAELPKKDQKVRVVGPSNHSLGGSLHEATTSVSNEAIALAEKLAVELQLPIVGIDCLVNDKGYFFIEANASPNIGIHDSPYWGTHSSAAAIYAQLLAEGGAVT